MCGIGILISFTPVFGYNRFGNVLSKTCLLMLRYHALLKDVRFKDTSGEIYKTFEYNLYNFLFGYNVK